MDHGDLIRAPRRLETPRLKLEVPCLAHAPAFLDSLNTSLPNLGFVGWGQRARDLAWAERFCQRGGEIVERGENLIFNAFESEGGTYVGRIDLHSFDFDAPRCEVGYVGDVRSGGRGLMREAVLAVVDLAFALGFARVQAMSDVRNVRALHFAEHALGFRREGVLRYYERDEQGRLGEQVMFALCNPAAI